MGKNRTRVRKTEKYLHGLNVGQSFQVVLSCKEVDVAKLRRAGLGQLNIGESALPKDIGPTSRFNANGKYQLHKDLPKEDRYITTFEWSWEQWAPGGGTETQYDFVDVIRPCYQRTLLPPPALEIGKILVKGEEYFVSKLMHKSDDVEDKEVLHAFNLFLELFGDFDIVADGNFSKTNFEKANWKFLPPGEYPWSQIVSHVRSNNRRSERYLKVIVDRQDFLLKKNPVRVFTGQGGFREYIAYVFKDFAILDSITLGNALYVFGDDWEHVSKLTKAQIITGNLAKARVIHREGWKYAVSGLIMKLVKQTSASKRDVEI